MSNYFEVLVGIVILGFGAIALTDATPATSQMSDTTSGIDPIITGVGFFLVGGVFLAAIAAVRALRGGGW